MGTVCIKSTKCKHRKEENILKIAVFWDIGVHQQELTASVIRVVMIHHLMIQAVSCCEMLVISTRLQSATSHKATIFILIAVKTSYHSNEDCINGISFI
jgi:hypothetical protein